MATILRLDRPTPGGGARWFLGALVSSRCHRVDAALVAVTGDGLDARIWIEGRKNVAVPNPSVTLYRQLSGTSSGTSGSGSAEMIALLRAELAEVEASLAVDLPAECGVAQNRVQAVGVHDPGLWSLGKTLPRRYMGLCDAARVAELTGASVIDAFPARDLAQCGQGGPIAAVAEWILLKDLTAGRLLLDLGRTIRMSYLPADREPTAPGRVLSFEVGPGMRLLDLLTRQLTGGREEFDPGGRLAVQGRKITELLEHWLSDSSFERPLPRWSPHGVRPERFLVDAMRMAVDADWSVRDLLCTATHFIAESIGRAVRRRLPKDARIDQIVVTGGGRHNGMLLREIAARSPDSPLLQVGDLGIPSEALGPAAVAVLAMFYVDQVPANHTALTGADVPRVLGRMTPGSPRNWQRLLHQMAGSPPAVRPLRSAL